jgi:hypothetical protein
MARQRGIAADRTAPAGSGKSNASMQPVVRFAALC